MFPVAVCTLVWLLNTIGIAVEVRKHQSFPDRISCFLYGVCTTATVAALLIHLNV